MSELVPRAELQAAVKAQRELGPEYEDAVVDSLVEKIEQKLAERQRALRPKRLGGPERMLGSLGLAIPLLGVAGATAGLPGVIAVCIALVLVNLIVAFRG